MPNALVVIAQKGYQDLELAGTRDGLAGNGFDVVLSSKEAGECTGKLGGSEIAVVAMRDVDLDDYNRVVFIGGPGAAKLDNDADALHLANATVREGKPIGAICLAPMILVKARLLGGKRATVWESPETLEAFKQYGVEYTAEAVTVDGKIVTGNGPDAAIEFGHTIASRSL
ncbi:MAG: DJ-1/PfpI family protein [bacterium]|nr:DJ-1/PfpI family protein [bacterium]